MKKIKGFGLIEVMIAVVILAVGILGSIQLQVNSMKDFLNSENAIRASMLLDEMANKIIANPTGASDEFYEEHGKSWIKISALDSVDTSSCYSSGCNAELLAIEDLKNWAAMIINELPESDQRKGKVCFDSTPIDPSTGESEWSCDGINIGIDSAVASEVRTSSIVYTIKVRWKDTKGNIKVMHTQVTIPKT